MIELLREIPGPTFLLLYAAIIALGIVLGRRWIAADGSGHHSMPSLTRLDPAAIALLRADVNEVIRTCLFALMEKGRVKLEEEAGKWGLTAEGKGQDLPPLERTLFAFIGNGRRPGELFTDGDLRIEIESHLRPLREELGRLHLYRTEPAVRAARIKKAVAIVTVLGIGLIKLDLGLSAERPVGFLVILLVVGAVVLLAMLKVGRVSALGRRYLQELERHFAWMRKELARGVKPTRYDPALPMALFGVGALAALPQYEAFAASFSPRHGLSGDSSGGCGGSDGGSSSDSSSGCSGGGGCGGCGGGGGD